MAGQTVVVSVLADTKKFSKAMGQLGNSTGLSKLGRGLKNIGSKFASWGKTAVKAIGVVALAMVGLALKGGFERMMKIEGAEAKLKGLGHSAKSVDKIMENALGAVKGTAFGLDEAATTAATAVAAGIKPGKELEKYLTLVADAATIAGIDMGEMGSIMNKVQANGKAMTENLNQLSDRGIPILGWLADEYGVTTAEMSKMVSQGKVDAETFNKVLEENIGGAAQESGKTTEGAFKNMKAALSRAGQAMLTEVFPMFKDAFNGITTWLDGLTDKMKPFGEAVGKWFADTAVPAVKKFGSAVLPVLKKFGSWVSDKLIPAVKDAGGAIKDALGDSFERFGAWFKDNKGSMEGLGKTIGETIVNAVKTLGDILAGTITTLTDLGSWVVKNKDWLSALAVGITAAVVAFKAYTVAVNIAKAVQLLFNAVLAANPIGLIITAVAALVAGLIYFFTQTETGKKAWAAFTGALSAGWQKISGAFKTGYANVKNWLGKALAFIKLVWKFSPLGIITGNWSKIIGFFKGLPGKIKAIFLNAIAWLKSGGSKILQGLKNGASTAWTNVKAWFKNLPTSIKNIFSNAVNFLGAAGGRILRGLKTGASNAWAGVKTWFKNIPTSVKNTFSNAGNWLLNAGGKIISGLLSGISAGFTRVRNKLSELTNLLPDWKGPAKKDKTLLTGAGELIINGFIKGLENKYGAVKKSLKGFTSDLSRTDMGTIEGPGISMTAAVAGAGAGGSAAYGNTYNITVQALAPSPEIGRQVTAAIRDFERLNGGARR